MGSASSGRGRESCSPRDLAVSLERSSVAELLRLVAGGVDQEADWERLGRTVSRALSGSRPDLASFLSKLDLEQDQLLRLTAAVELLKRFHNGGEGARILCPRDVFLISQELRRKKREFFVLLMVDSKHELIGKETVSIGTLNASLVHPRELFLPAIVNSASEIMLVHNHPSGDLTPSKEDLALTRRVSEAGKLLGIELLDHVIVSRRGYRSLREEGFL